MSLSGIGHPTGPRSTGRIGRQVAAAVLIALVTSLAILLIFPLTCPDVPPDPRAGAATRNAVRGIIAWFWLFRR